MNLNSHEHQRMISSEKRERCIIRIERAAASGVSFVAEPGGSLRDDLVIEAANKHDMVMCFTGMRLFHH